MKHSVVKEIELKLEKCISCRSEDIEIDNCGYSSFDVAWAKCKNCGNKVEINPCAIFDKAEVAEKWNAANNVQSARTNYENQIKALQAKIDALPRD